LTTEGTTPAGQSVACRAVADEAAAESMQLEEEEILSRAINAILPFTRGVQSDIQRQAVYALANMAASGKYRAAAMEAGAVPILVDLLAAQDDSIRLQVMSIRLCEEIINNARQHPHMSLNLPSAFFSVALLPLIRLESKYWAAASINERNRRENFDPGLPPASMQKHFRRTFVDL